MRIPESIRGIDLDGGHPALDFVNTVHTWTDADPRDYWSTPVELVAWHQHRGLITPATADAIGRLAPAAARRLLGQARDARRRLHALFAGIAATGRADKGALGWLEEALGPAAGFRHLETSGGRVAWTVRADPASPASLLAPVLFAAAELLTTADFGRIRSCPPPDGCGWLFLDTSRNGRRVWCNMRACGNAAKVRRFRKRALRVT
jgi:predicted RNA-binding Zn ribbon-like protein